jgi:hypothetical protein
MHSWLEELSGLFWYSIKQIFSVLLILLLMDLIIGNASSQSVYSNNTTSKNYPSVHPVPVGPASKVDISADYSDLDGIANIHIDIRGPNLGSADPKLAPPIIGSSSLSLATGTMRNGIWNGSFIFPSNLPDGNYVYSVIANDTAGNVSEDGPFSGIILDRHGNDNYGESQTSIISAKDGSGNIIPNNGTTTSSNITFAFSGADKTGVVIEFQCNIDDTSVQGGQEHMSDPSMPKYTYPSCYVPDKIAERVTGNYSMSNLASGKHTFKIRVVDNEYNVDKTPEVFNWTISPPP